MPVSRLSQLQRDLLIGFSRRAPEFFLSGGAALAHFHLGHRDTEDLDFFVCQDVLPQGQQALEEAAREIGASVTPLTDEKDFKRYLVARGPESIKVDLVRERVPQIAPKAIIDGIQVDRPEEILANKLTVLTRQEVRDLVDIWYLEESGLRIEDVFPAAMKKEVFTPAELANAISSWQLVPSDQPAGGPAVDELRAYLRELVDRLAAMAFPDQG